MNVGTQCPKCRGIILADSEGLYCLQCGWRPTIMVSQPVQRHRQTRKLSRQFKLTLLEEYLNETSEAVHKAKKWFREHQEFRAFLEHLWREDNLAEKFTLKHLALMELWSLTGDVAIESLEKSSILTFLDRFSFAARINRESRKAGHRGPNTRTLDIAVKLVLWDSYRRLLNQEVEKELNRAPYCALKQAQVRAHMLMRSAHRYARCMTRSIGVEFEWLQSVLNRALWEDHYEPIVLVKKGLVADISY